MDHHGKPFHSVALLQETSESVLHTMENVLTKFGGPVPLNRMEHIRYCCRRFKGYPWKYEKQDAQRGWMHFWIIHALELLGAVPKHGSLLEKWIIQSIAKLQSESGGFGGNSGFTPHSMTTYACIHTLAIIGTEEALNVINVPKLKDFLKRIHVSSTFTPKHPSLLAPPGSFHMESLENSDTDCRSAYCAIASASLCGILDDELTESVGRQIKLCQTYEGGISGTIGAEAHGGYTYCAMATLGLLAGLGAPGEPCFLEKKDGKVEWPVDLEGVEHWLSQRQCSKEGGFDGRTHKLVDTCYSFWQGAGCVVTSFISHLLKQNELVGIDDAPTPKDEKACTDGTLPVFGRFHSIAFPNGKVSESLVKLRTERARMEKAGRLCESVTGNDEEVFTFDHLDESSSDDSSEQMDSSEHDSDSDNFVMGEKKVRMSRAERKQKKTDTKAKLHNVKMTKARKARQELVDLAKKRSHSLTYPPSHHHGIFHFEAPFEPTSTLPCFDANGLLSYSFTCAQDTFGGLKDKPSTLVDDYHTCYGLSGMSLASHQGHVFTDENDEHCVGDVTVGFLGEQIAVDHQERRALIEEIDDDADTHETQADSENGTKGWSIEDCTEDDILDMLDIEWLHDSSNSDLPNSKCVPGDDFDYRPLTVINPFHNISTKHTQFAYQFFRRKLGAL
ncbi:putative Protein farnesyltransferase subunit beta [Blattamonas nauphoetae]|uniref:Prenyltransferase alpha-alpha toroid domain-containing protein n=1 Tax=Blattamonas nauphoetae TaxID=2049346 RepID=A0ABQ9YHN1_9EUKA|nr:putative Protein farnesyltransferase subunit beta [Blattamonas nauphoetae]